MTDLITIENLTPDETVHLIHVLYGCSCPVCICISAKIGAGMLKGSALDFDVGKEVSNHE